MPQLGPMEILVVLVVALLVFGPNRLPEISRQVGRGMRELRRLQDQVKDDLHEVLHGDDPAGDTLPTAASATVPQPSGDATSEAPAPAEASSTPASEDAATNPGPVPAPPAPSPANRAPSRFRPPPPRPGS